MNTEKLSDIHRIFNQFQIENPNSFSSLMVFLNNENIVKDRNIQDFLIHVFIIRNHHLNFKENWLIVKFIIIRDFLHNDDLQKNNLISSFLYINCIDNLKKFILNDDYIKNKLENDIEVIFDMSCIYKCLFRESTEKNHIQRKFFLFFQLILELKEKILLSNNLSLYNILNDIQKFEKKSKIKKFEFKNENNSLTKNENNSVSSDIIMNRPFLIENSLSQKLEKIILKCNSTRIEINELLSFNFFKQKINELFAEHTIKKLGSFALGLFYSIDKIKYNIDLMLFYNVKKKENRINDYKTIIKNLSSIQEFNFDFSNSNIENKEYIPVKFKNKSISNNKIFNLRIYFSNQLYWYSSTIIEKLYLIKNIRATHIFYSQILIEKINFLKSNFELIILILNFLNNNFHLINERKKEKFVYFNCEDPYNNSSLTENNIILFYPEFEKEVLNKINNIDMTKLIFEFGDFMNNYFSYLLNENSENEKNNLIFEFDDFRNENFIFNRGNIDKRYIDLNKQELQDFKKKIKNFNYYKGNIFRLN